MDHGRERSSRVRKICHWSMRSMRRVSRVRLRLDVQPQDIDVVPAQENFFAVDTVGTKSLGGE